MFCSKCGAENSDQARYCSGCGAGLLENSPGKTVGNDVQAYYEAAVGFKNADYYLSRFNRFDSQGLGASWNWPSVFISFYWLLYRKMWLWALLYFFLPYLILLVGASISDEFIAVVYLVQLTVIFIVFPMYANALYYKHVSKKVLAAKNYTDDEDKRLRIITDGGGTSGVALFVVLLFVGIAMIGILAAIALPAYQDYIESANTAKLQSHYEEGIRYTENELRRVNAYVATGQLTSLAAADDTGSFTEPGFIAELNSAGGTAPGGGLPYANAPNPITGVIGVEISGTFGGGDWRARFTRPQYGGFADEPVADHVISQ